MRLLLIFWLALSLLVGTSEALAAKWSLTAGSGDTAYGEKLLRSEIRVEQPLLQLGNSNLSATGQLEAELSARLDDLTPEMLAGVRLEQSRWGSELQIGQNRQRLQTDWSFELLPRVTGRVGLRHDQTELQGFSGIGLQLMPGVKITADYLTSSTLSYWLFGVGWE